MKNAKRINIYILTAVIFFIISIIFILITYFIVNMRYAKYNSLINTTILQIVNNVKEKYPEVSEDEIIKVLQDKNINNQKNFLSEYGYEDNIIYLNSLKKEFKTSNLIYFIMIVSFISILFIVILIYILDEKKRIHNINNYLKKVNNGEYELIITENTDDEISKLRNEIYKTTVLLRESAENSKKENVNLSNSIADISHQLKTPLTSMRIMIDNIEDSPNMDDETKKSFINNISRQIDWMSSLVISLLKLSRFDAGMVVMQDKEILIKDLLKNVIENLSIIIELKNIDIEMMISDDAKVRIDYNWQLEALTNIVKNAIEHSKEKSKIYINVENTSVFLKIVIKDQGEGINKEDIKHIFERFYKAKNSSENNIGIGLALAKTIIEKDNGYIIVNSKEGKGTEFIIKYLK